jgi:hypothetical protein
MSTSTATPTQSAAAKVAPRPAAKKVAPTTGKKLAHNLFTGIGRLGREPELRYSGDGRAWCKTSLAIFQGEEKEPLWLDLKAFAKPLDAGGWDESVPLALAELEKGQKVSVRGKLYCDKREYNGKDYVDWGLVLYAAPTIVSDEKQGDDETGAAGEPD